MNPQECVGSSVWGVWEHTGTSEARAVCGHSEGDVPGGAQSYERPGCFDFPVYLSPDTPSPLCVWPFPEEPSLPGLTRPTIPAS